MFSTLLEKHDTEKLSRYIEQLASCLANSAHAVPLTRATSFPDKPGVYCLFEHNTLVYVGETGSLSARMRHIPYRQSFLSSVSWEATVRQRCRRSRSKRKNTLST